MWKKTAITAADAIVLSIGCATLYTVFIGRPGWLEPPPNGGERRTLSQLRAPHTIALEELQKGAEKKEESAGGR